MEEETAIFRHSQAVQIRFNDIDLLGHVNNSVYFSFYDLGKSAYFAAVRSSAIDWRHVDVVIANVNADFLAPIYPNETITVQTRTVEIGHRSFRLEQRIINTITNEIKSYCRTVMVGFDMQKGIAAELSDEWKDALCSFEQKDLLKKERDK